MIIIYDKELSCDEAMNHLPSFSSEWTMEWCYSSSTKLFCTYVIFHIPIKSETHAEHVIWHLQNSNRTNDG